ncbi:MAG: A/G-specific adenine glycosylase [Nitriliruptoraceae bacterium]
MTSPAHAAPPDPPDAPDAATRSRLTTDLLTWATNVRADLPWRRTRDPWAVLVSELMLQQTQVPRVVPRYLAFLERFPTVTACAGATVAEVVRAWEGLGYNRRAVNLHRAAEVVVAEHGGRLPDRLDDLLALPGVGPYTARAVLTFAFQRDHGVVDTNAARFLARAASGHRLTARAAQQLADELVPLGHGWAWNQAVLDLGSQVCTKRAPRCGACPIRSSCAWARTGFAAPDPADGTAGTSGKQPRFAGSDRQGRGRLVQALRTGPVDLERVADAAGWPDEPDRARRVADGLVGEGMAEYVDGQLALPDQAR